ncbi:MAG: N-acetylmuramoyl-L-alanine amidase [Anaerolineales bacterium]|jgi:N-acetylmuramoyl-L-alanine amidase
MEERVERRLRDERPLRVNMFRHLGLIFSIGAVLATFFTTFTPYGLTYNFGQAYKPPEDDPNLVFLTPTPRPRPTIGLVAGHWGLDTGATCPDGLTEVSINLEVATYAKQLLTDLGYDVDLLQEKDERLDSYKALVLVSVHADSCAYFGTDATGFKVAPTFASARPEKSERLVACIYSRYQEVTGLPFHRGITDDMTSYHTFDEIHTDTTAAIIETGFMNLDRQILENQPELIAQGIVNGILCYIRNEDASLPDNP